MSKHTEKILKGVVKNSAQTHAEGDGEETLRQQYEIIKGDLMKLREDLEKGYDMAKHQLNSKAILGAVLGKK